MQTIIINEAENGAMVTINDTESINATVYEFDEDNQQGLVNLLYEIVNKIGCIDGFNKETINISVEHGDEYDCNDKSCKICKGNK